MYVRNCARVWEFLKGSIHPMSFIGHQKQICCLVLEASAKVALKMEQIFQSISCHPLRRGDFSPGVLTELY